jgi:hypothetical protein
MRVTIWQRAIIAAALQARERLASNPDGEDARRDLRLVRIGQELVGRLEAAGVELTFPFLP